MSIFSNHYYHRHFENFIVAVGELFSNIGIVKTDSAGNIIKEYDCQIEYAPKNKWISRIREQNALTGPQVKITLPRMAFEISDIQYAPDRKIGVNGSYAIGNNNGVKGKIFPPTPYDVIINLYLATKDGNDSFQVIEQILPYFQPYISVKYLAIPEYNVNMDVPITMQSFQEEDTFEGSSEEVRTITTTFTLSAQMNFFGPMIPNANVIKDVIISLSNNINFSRNMSVIQETVTPLSANSDGVYTITEKVTENI